MSLAERADLTARLSLDDKFSGPLRKVTGNAGVSLKKLAAGTAIGNTLSRATERGVRAVFGQLTSGLDSLGKLEDATTSLNGAIAQVGKGWTITGAQIAAQAVKIEGAVQSAFDDKDIAQATTTLVRYGGITQKNLFPAMQIMTDLAAKTGDVGSASALLGKALADPEKAAGKLARTGVVLTKEEQKQIKTLVDAGKKGKAQALILDLLAKKTKGAAAAMHGPFVDAQRELGDAVEEAQKALAIGFLPVLTEVRKELTEALAKPENLQKIKDFGQGLADGFRDVVKFAKSIPWDKVVDGVNALIGFGKGVATAFMSLPPDVKNILIGLTALNKLSGGAVIKISADLVSTGLSTVFGRYFDRGSSPVNPLYVTGAIGGGGGPGGVVTGGGGILGVLSKVFIVGMAAEVAEQISPSVTQAGVDFGKLLFPDGPPLAFLNKPIADWNKDMWWPFGRKGMPEWAGGDFPGLLPDYNNDPTKPKPPKNPLSPGEQPGHSEPVRKLALVQRAIEESKDAHEARMIALKSSVETKGQATITGIMSAKAAQITAIDRDRSSVVSAIQNNKPVVNVKVTVSGMNVTVTQTGGTLNRTGPSGVSGSGQTGQQGYGHGS